MPESLLGGILGDEDDKPEVEAPEALAGADAFAAAIAAIASRQDPGVARKTEEFLSDQSHLLKIQADHLKDEHALRLAHLRYQSDLLRRQRLGQTLRIGFQLFIALVATVIGVGGAVMIRDAVTSRRVVIEPFHAPPDLTARGIDGAVVAAGLLDQLTRLQDATHSSSAARDLTGAWTGNIKLDVPETGVSLGEISRLLKERFGHDVHIDGDLVETSTGDLALTVRGQGVPPKTFLGTDTELAKLTIEAAEYVYSKSQPARWTVYLTEVDRNEEAIAFCRAAIAGADPTERPRLLNTWALANDQIGGSNRESLALLRAAVKLQPDYWVAHNNIQNELMILGDEEGAWRAGEDMRAIAGKRPGRAPETNYANWDYLTWNLQVWLGGLVANAEANGGVGTLGSSVGPAIADVDTRLHDPDAADLALKTTVENPNDPAIAAMTHFVRGRLAAEAGDAARAASEMEVFAAAYADPAVVSSYAGYHCWAAPAEEAAGRRDKADALLKTAGTFVDCYRFRADILDNRGDWTGAQKAYAEAVALAPDLPAAYFSWGVALLKHGDLAGAEAKLMDANKRGPHWADPLKMWGDVLTKQGSTKEALAKYDEALKYAPNWKQLKDAREAAAQQKG
jgi:tetratricopeptide (TPR) repeat protein